MGRVTQTTNAGVQVITEHYAYDAAGHLTQIIYADGTVTNTEYNVIGNRTTFGYGAADGKTFRLFPDKTFTMK